jgi:hypothetical protein
MPSALRRDSLLSAIGATAARGDNHHANLPAELHEKQNHQKVCAKQANQAKQGKQANLDGTARREKVCAMLTILTMLEVLK